MPTDFISLFTACLIAACAPIIARIIPRGLVPETVIWRAPCSARIWPA